jgi:dGTP triphosphohydrolase
MTQGADYNSEKSTVSLRQYVEKLIQESDKRNEAQFLAAKEAVAAALAAAEKAVSAALVAQDKLTSAAFVAAKEALAEAQTQLTAYKASANEWRATLNDLISTIMVRKEVEALISGLNVKIDGLSRVQNMMIGGILLLQVVLFVVLKVWK